MSDTLPLTSETIARMANIVGAANILTDASDVLPFSTEERNKFPGLAGAVVRPSTPDEVAGIIKIAADTGTAVIPQGGNTGLVGGQVPDGSGTQVVVSLGRLNKIRAIDPASNTISVDAGVILTDVQNAADKADRLFPLSLGSEGSCQIGGNLGSNAGGINVLAYGNARDLVLGLEVVLADGRIWDGMRALRKNNTGYDLKNLFVGSEGTLGIITGAVLKLFPKPRDVQTAFIGVQSPAKAIELLHLAQGLSGDLITSFELMPRFGLEQVFKHIPNTRDPLGEIHPWYVLMVCSGGTEMGALAPVFETILTQGIENGLIDNAAIAQNQAQAKDFWRIREEMPEAQKHEGGSIKQDISIPIAAIPDFIEEGITAAQKVIPGCRPMPFGHLGDGNLHFNITQPEGMDIDTYLAVWQQMNEAIFELVHRYNGSISAEHGIGQLKRDLMPSIMSPVELEMMRGIKDLLDPGGILNPGRLLPPEKS